ncbi:MAG TPA: protein kinase, partial [Polyangiaceae bacterium]|nr:protein kinase [Polyangiaceae bacterium]
AHAAGVVHRDVSPDQILLAKTGPKLADVGIARAPDSAWPALPQGAATLAYTPPETIQGGAFSPAGDQFAMAATLYEALTGLRAFAGDDPAAVATLVAGGKHAPPTHVVPGLRGFTHLDAIFERALAKEPRARFTSTEAFGDSLAAELEGTNMLAFTPPAPSSIVPRATRRWQNAVAALAVLIIGALVVLGRFQRPDDNLSLRAVASSFSAAITPPRAPTRTPAMRAEPPPPPTAPAGGASSTDAAAFTERR